MKERCKGGDSVGGKREEGKEEVEIRACGRGVTEW